MKILACGDIHLNTTALNRAFALAKEIGVDLIVLAGDFCDAWKVPHNATSKDVIEQARPLIEVIKNQSIPVFFVLGNHDPPDLATELSQLSHVTDLHAKQIEFLNYTFAGVGEVDAYPNLGSCDVLVTHSPPILRHGGTIYIISAEVYQFIVQFKPLISISGHIHNPQKPVEKLPGDTTFLFLGDLAEEKVGFLELSKSARKIERIDMIPL